MKKFKVILLILSLCTAAFLFFQNMSRIPELLQIVFEWVGRRGVMAPAYFIAVYTLCTFLLLPILLLSMAGGFLFGVMPGALIVTFAVLFSSVLAYLTSHYFLRQRVHRLLEKNRLLQTIDQVVKHAGWKMVILTRLAPIFPFIPLNFAYGVSQIGFWNFLLASLIGFLPGAFLNAYLGSVAGSLIGIKAHAPLPGEWILLILSVIAAITATVYMTKITREVLRTGDAVS